MKIYTEQTPYEFLMNRSWNCEWLKDQLNAAGGRENEVNAYVEGMFPDGIGETELNDFFRFEWQILCDDLGIPYEE